MPASEAWLQPAHPLCVPSASAHPVQHTCRCSGAGVGRGLKEPLQEGPWQVTRRPGPTRPWAPCAARRGRHRGKRLRPRGAVLPEAFPSAEPSSQANCLGP